MSIPLLCTAVLALLLFGTGLAVSLARRKSHRGAGYDDDPTDSLFKRVRAHGNTTEYAPMFGVLFLALSSLELASWEIGTIIAATTCRGLIVVGILVSKDMNKPQPLRFVGALGTYLTGFALCAALLLHL